MTMCWTWERAFRAVGGLEHVLGRSRIGVGGLLCALGQAVCGLSPVVSYGNGGRYLGDGKVVARVEVRNSCCGEGRLRLGEGS
jgi:hypothetical protein